MDFDHDVAFGQYVVLQKYKDMEPEIDRLMIIDEIEIGFLGQWMILKDSESFLNRS